MDHKHEMTSETEEKENSGVNGENSNRQNIDVESGSNPTDNDPGQMLQFSEPFFVADTLEDDESMIIPPTQEDTAPFLIPSTPVCESKSNKKMNVDPNESSITVLEETCIDLENKAEEKDASKQDINESDLTQDLELEPTQPIIPSNLKVKVEFKFSNDADRDDDDDDDDEWQLKFSESQTQDILNFGKDDDDNKETKQKIISQEKETVKDKVDVDDDDDLPDTLCMEVASTADKKDHDDSITTLNPHENIEAMEIQSDDEIEPSQSCLSEYKGETISTSFKVQSNVNPQNIEESVKEIPNLHSATKLSVENSVQNDVSIEVLSEKRTIDISESDPETVLNDKSHSFEDISIISSKDETDIEHIRTKRPENEKISNSSLKMLEKEVIEIKSNGEQIKNDGVTRVEQNDEKGIKFINEEETKSDTKKNISSVPVTNLNQHSNEIVMEEESEKPTKELCKVSEEVTKDRENRTEENIEINYKKTENQEILIIEDNKDEKSLDIKNTGSLKQDLINKAELNDSEPLKKPGSDETATKSGEVSQTVEPETSKTAGIASDSEPNKLASEILKPSANQVVDEKFEISPISFAMAPPPLTGLPPLTGRYLGSARKQKFQNKTDFHHSIPVDERNSVASTKNKESLQNFFKLNGIPIKNEQMEMILSEKEHKVITLVFAIENQEVFATEYSIETEVLSRSSGELADISSSLSSGKSGNSCGIPIEPTSHSINILSSQDTTSEIFPKTSTQKSQGSRGFSDIFTAKEPVEVPNSEPKVSPIKSEKITKSVIPKGKRGKKNVDVNLDVSSSEASSTNEPKRKRRKENEEISSVEDKGSETEESKDLVTEVKPRKTTRKKKASTKSSKSKVEATETDSSCQEEVNFGSILPGARVMARWKDGFYYSGRVEKQETDGRWAVQFEDGFLHTITAENLIKIGILPKRTSVLVQSPDDYYDPGIVSGHFREGDTVGYEIELDNGQTRRYSRSAVILSSDQAKLIMGGRPPTTANSTDLNLDNIMHSKRSSKPIQSPVSTQSPVKKKYSRITRSKMLDPSPHDTSHPIASEETSDNKRKSEDKKPPSKKRKGKKVAGKESSSSAMDISNPIVAASTSTNTNSIGKKGTKVLPQRSAKKLFMDYAFLLTNADRKVVPKPTDSDAEYSKEDDEDIVPFDKDELCSQIISEGGKVLEKFDDIKKCTRKNIYLLANSYLRTVKYIQCIAGGISCIKHHWVQNCIFKSEILSINSYILPSGFSLVTQKVIEWHGNTEVFKGFKIALVSAPESPFVFTWAPVLLAAKAEFVQKWNLPSRESDVLITNYHCPPDIIQSAKKRKIPIVSSEWIIQCLIMGRKLPFNAHPKFKHDYTDI